MECKNYKVNAITVSKNYSKILEVCLKQNLKFLEKWYIVTQEDDIETINLIKETNDPKIELVLYPLDPRKTKANHKKSLLVEEEDLKLSTPDYLDPKEGCKRTVNQKKFYNNLVKNGVTFDKGGAIRQVQKHILVNQLYSKDDLVLMLDSDIVLPKNFNSIISKIKFQYNSIYVCDRKNYLFHSDFLDGGGVIDKNSLVGAGYFQLYLHDKTKLCKRTYTAGWVDWEFKSQFKKTIQIKNLVVSHLGETDMNWSGKKTETFLFEDDLQGFCGANEIYYSDDETITKRNIINTIRVNRLDQLERKRGLPNYLLVGNIHTDVNLIMKLLDSSCNISFFQQTYPNCSFFGNYNVRHELWEKKFDFYLNSFPKITNHNWIDVVEFDLSSVSTTNLIKSRLTEVFRNKIKIWGEFKQPQIIICVKNPILRTLSHYQNYCNNFPASYNWNWKYPSRSLEKNIFDDSNKVIKSNTFICNSNYIHIIDWLNNELNIPLKNITFIDVSSSLKKIRNKLQSKIGVKLSCDNLQNQNNDVDIKESTKLCLSNFFADDNLLLKKYSGIDYCE